MNSLILEVKTSVFIYLKRLFDYPEPSPGNEVVVDYSEDDCGSNVDHCKILSPINSGLFGTD